MFIQIIRSLILFSGLFCLSGLSAQCLQREIAPSEKSELASWVFEGVVLEQHSVFDESDGHIYTLNLLQVNSNFKNKLPKQVYLTTRGGTWQNLVEQVVPSLNLRPGDTGLFYTVISANRFASLMPDAMVLEPAFGALSFEAAAETAYTADFAPVVTGISPGIVTAGTGDVLTISGSGFGNSPTGFALLQVRNPDIVVGAIAYQSVLFNHILSWSDSEIKIFVPGRDVQLNTSGAGSGAVRVINPFGQGTTSDQTIEVRYNRFVNGFKPTRLADLDGSGGYTLHLHSDLFSNPEAKAALERVVDNWKCSIHSNLKINSQATTLNCPAKDGINLIAFDDACALPVGTLAQTTQWFSMCPDGSMAVEEMDLIIDRNVAWNFGMDEAPPNKFDFESLVLHELGHAHGLGHTLDSLNALYPALYPGDTRRILDTDTRECGDKIVSESAASDCGGLGKFVPAPDCESGLDEIFSKDDFQITPNPVGERLQVQIICQKAAEVQLRVTALTGQQMFSEKNLLQAGKQNFDLDVQQFPEGIYFFSIQYGREVQTRKFVKF